MTLIRCPSEADQHILSGFLSAYLEDGSWEIAADLADAIEITASDNTPAARRFSYPLRLGEVLDFLKEPATKTNTEKIAFGPYYLDHRMRRLFSKDDDNLVISLTDKEYDILQILHGEKGKALSRDALLEKIWGYRAELETHTLETHIYRLRRKIERDPGDPEWLITTDAGYSLRSR